ncbi:MAG: DUF4332 domain-containing protein [Planctomycetaceae bacterium]|nr:DUF4332 domain-containing protein [Planctomycetaceae bacterium]
MRLHRIWTDDCESLASLQVDGIAPGLNVILGPNGSGKTTLLRFVRDLLSRPQHAATGLPAAGMVELESRSGPFKALRIPRPGHPDTLAVVAATSVAANAAQLQDAAAAPLLRFVEPINLHQTSALAALADEVTERLAAHDLGANWSLVRSWSPTGAHGLDSPARLLPVMSRLSVVPEDESSIDGLISGDLSRNDANWRIVIGALARQREQLSLECESQARTQTRQQREWETRLRWLSEYAVEQSVEVAQLDTDWQAADSDLRERDAAQQAVEASGSISPLAVSAAARTLADSLELLRQVLEDLAQDRLRILLAMARSTGQEHETLDAERHRIAGCEQEIVGQMQRLLRRHASASPCQCPTCGAAYLQASEQREQVATAALASSSCAELWGRLTAARERWAATQRHIARLEQWRARRGADPAIDRLRYRISELDKQVDELEACRQVEMAAAAIAQRHAVGRRHDVLKHAGERLSSLTAGRYLSLRWSAETSELRAEGNDGQSTPVVALSRGTHEQVAMALRLAVLHGLSALGSNGPVVWDEPLADSDEQRLDAAAEQLAQFAQSDSQLLLLTCREHVARAMEAHGAVVHRIGVAAERPVEISGMQDDAVVMPPISPVPEAVPVRVHPGSTFWLHLDSPLEHLPSLSLQQIRPLSSLGVADVRDLLEIDAAAESARLSDAQITVAQLQIWQAEARLLTQVGDITGRDAQLLVSCGILSRTDLAAAETDDLTRRVDRLRGGDTLRWRLGPSTAPHRETIERWIESARRQPPVDPSHRSEAAGQSRRRLERSTARRSLSSRTAAPPTPPAVALRFRLQPDSPIVDAPSIGHKTGRRLERVGIATVRDLLVCDPQQAAARLRHRRITADTVRAWQHQAGLMCSVPDLRCADAIVLVACGITGPLDLQRISAAALFATLQPFMAQAAGQRLLRGAAPANFEDIQRWIATVEESRIRRAA